MSTRTRVDAAFAEDLALGTMEGWIGGPTNPDENDVQYRVVTERYAEPDPGAEFRTPAFDRTDDAATGRKMAFLSLAAHLTDLDADVHRDLDTVLGGDRSEAFKTSFERTLRALSAVLDPTTTSPMVVRVESLDRDPLARFALTVHATPLPAQD